MLGDSPAALERVAQSCLPPVWERLFVEHLGRRLKIREDKDCNGHRTPRAWVTHTRAPVPRQTPVSAIARGRRGRWWRAAAWTAATGAALRNASEDFVMVMYGYYLEQACPRKVEHMKLIVTKY